MSMKLQAPLIMEFLFCIARSGCYCTVCRPIPSLRQKVWFNCFDKTPQSPPFKRTKRRKLMCFQANAFIVASTT
jgi:hypothetical protein